MAAWLLLVAWWTFAFKQLGFDVEQKTAIKEAIEIGEYDVLPTEVQEKISEEKFTEMAEKKAQRDAAKQAIAANDYDAFLDVAPEKMLEKIDEETFAEMVEKYNEMQLFKAELEAVVIANDFESFVVLVEQQKSDMQDHMGQAGKTHPKFEKMNELSEEELTEKLQEKFATLVEYYEEHGELPEHKRRWFRKRGRIFGWGK